MVYFTDFGEFFDKSKEMFTASPKFTRFVTKLRKCDGALVLKVTNDVACLKYKTESAADVKNVERLTSWFLSQATRKQAGSALKTAGGAGSGSAQ